MDKLQAIVTTYPIAFSAVNISPNMYYGSVLVRLEGKKYFQIHAAPVQTGTWAHPASNTMDNGSFQVVKRPGRGVYHRPHLAPRLKKE